MLIETKFITYKRFADEVPMAPMATASAGTQTDAAPPPSGLGAIASAEVEEVAMAGLGAIDSAEAVEAIETPSGGAVGAIEEVGAIGPSGEPLPRASWADWATKSGY